MPNPNLQQRALLNGEVFVELDKKVLLVKGEDRLSWLNDIFSQKMDNLKPNQSVEALWLDVQGHVLRDFHIFDDSEKTYLITFAENFEQLLPALQRLVFRAKVTLEISDLKVIGSFEKPVSDLCWKDPWPATTEGGWRYGKNPESDWNYFESLVTNLPEAESVPLEALTSLRVAAWRPWGPDEIDEKSLPHEYDWLATAVHLDKGCYRGQETVAKIHNLGAPPRRLVFLHLDGSGHELAAAGDEIISDAVIGKITSVANHFEMGPIALGIVKRSTKENTVSIKLKSGEIVSANLEEIVPKDAGGVVDLGDFRKR